MSGSRYAGDRSGRWGGGRSALRVWASQLESDWLCSATAQSSATFPSECCKAARPQTSCAQCVQVLLLGTCATFISCVSFAQ